MPDNRELNIVDEAGNVIGIDTRENIHNNGLLHREIHIWFYTPKGDIIFQHRAKDKDTNPDLLDATVGGHVEIGSDYESAALQELMEETGIAAKKEHLAFIQMVRSNILDTATNKTNNVMRAIYAYRYEKNVEDLKVEKGKAIGFESWPLEKIFTLSNEEKKRFILSVLEKENLEIYTKIKKLI